jgi:mono/diheme cytochrome c family protein
MAVGAIAAVLLTCIPAVVRPHEASSAAHAALVARGFYLTGDAGQCSDCHGIGLHGGKVIPAPSLAGLIMFANDADAIHFFETALTPAGKPVPPPMPHFKFHPDDAKAIVAYLRQLR